MLRHVDFAKRNGSAAILVMVLAILAFSQPLQAQNTTITGVVRNAAGQPLEGAFVRVRSADSGLTFMVVSQAQGRYNTPNTLPGKYTIEGIGGDFQSNPSGPVEVRSGQQQKMDVQLTAARKATAPRKRMTQEEHASTMPEGPAKKLILSKCVLCHSLDGASDTRTLRVETSRQQWEEVMAVHKYYMEDLPQALSSEEVDMIVGYMAQHFNRETRRAPGPEQGARPDPNSHLPRTLLKGTEAKYVMMEFNLRSGARPHDISVDSQGVPWIAEHGENEQGVDERGVYRTLKEGVGLLSRFDPEGLKYTQLPPPRGKFPTRSSGAAVDPQGIVWHVDNGQNTRMVAYNPKTGDFKTYPMPAPPRLMDWDGTASGDESPKGDGSANMNTLIFHDGFVWGSGLLSGQIYRLDPASGGVITYPFPKGKPPYGLAFDNNKMLWASLEFADEIVKLDTGSGKLVRYKVPTPKADLRHIQTDADGNVWASAQQSDKLIKVDTRTGHMTEYAPPTPLSGIASVDVDRKQNLIWVAEAQADKMARFDPRTNTFTEFPLPSLGTGLKRIAVDPSNPNRVWWCAFGSDRIGYIEVVE